MAGVHAARIVAPLFSVIALHGVIVTDSFHLAPGALSLGFVVAIAAGLADSRRNARALRGLCIAVAVLWGFQALALFLDARMAMVVKLPPILIHGWVAWIFGRTLLPGREPLIRRFSRLTRGAAVPELREYTRTMTLLWALAMAAMAAFALFMAIAATAETWSWAVNICLPLASLALFVGDHAYRAIRFRHLGTVSPLQTIRMLAQPRTWTVP